MNNFFQRNLTIKAISLLLAVLLWIFVSNVQNPTREREFRTVPLTYKGLEKPLAVVRIPAQVTVRVRGNADQVDSMGIRDLIAYVDLSGVGPGTKSLEIKLSAPPGVQVVSIIPQKVSVTVDEWQTKQVPVNIEYMGKLAKNYRALGPVLKPQKVVVKGPRSLLQKIDQVFVNVDLKNSTQDIQETLPVQVRQSGGEFGHGGIEVDPRVVEIRIPVQEILPTKKVAIKPVVTGQPLAGYKVEAVVATPSFVTVVGLSTELDKIDALETVPIDITGKQREFKQQAAVSLPKGIQLVKEEKTLVTVQIVPNTVGNIEGGILTGVSVSIHNANPTNKVTLTPNKVDVTWTGQQDPNLELWVDVANLSPGVHQVLVQSKHEPSMQLTSLGPEHISVLIE